MLIVNIDKLLFGVLIGIQNSCVYVNVMAYTKPLLYHYGDFQSLSVNKKKLIMSLKSLVGSIFVEKIFYP